MVRGKTLEGRITRLKASGAHGSKTVPGRPQQTRQDIQARACQQHRLLGPTHTVSLTELDPQTLSSCLAAAAGATKASFWEDLCG